MTLSVSGSMPVTWPRVSVGTPRPPKHTGDVLASRHSTAARIGGTPRPTSMAPHTATGEPAPAAPSRNAPKQKPISTACTRASPLSAPMLRRMTANSPVSTVRLYRSMAANTVQPMGSRPKAMPCRKANPACVTGIPYTPAAMRMAVSGPGRPGQAGHPPPADQQVEEDQHRQGGHEGGQPAVAEGVEVLDVHAGERRGLTPPSGVRRGDDPTQPPAGRKRVPAGLPAAGRGGYVAAVPRGAPMTCAVLALLLTTQTPPPMMSPALWRRLQTWEEVAKETASIVSERGTKTVTTPAGATTTFDASVWLLKPDRVRLRLDRRPAAGQKPDPNDFTTYILNDRSLSEYDGLARTVTEYPLGPGGAADTHPLLVVLGGRMTAAQMTWRYDIEWVRKDDPDYLMLEFTPRLPQDRQVFDQMTLALVLPGDGLAYLPRTARIVKPHGAGVETWVFPTRWRTRSGRAASESPRPTSSRSRRRRAGG